MKQYEAVIETLKRLGGCATFGQLNQEVFKIEDCTWNTKTPFASIRRIDKTARKSFVFVRDYGLWRNIEAAWRVGVSWHKMQPIRILSRCRNSIIPIIRDFCCISVT